MDFNAYVLGYYQLLLADGVPLGYTLAEYKPYAYHRARDAAARRWDHWLAIGGKRGV